MGSQSNDFSYFLTGERNLESLAEDYFSARPVDEQDTVFYWNSYRQTMIESFNWLMRDTLKQTKPTCKK